MTTEEVAAPAQTQRVSIEAILVGLQPRLRGFVSAVELNPKCKHDWEAHRIRSAEVKFVFSKLDAESLIRAAEAGRWIREEMTQAVIIRKLSEVM